MEPEVQAAIIKAASDWALFILKDLPSPSAKEDEAALEVLEFTFRRTYEIIVNVVQP